MPGSPAAADGLKPGDIVVKAAGQPVIYRGDLRFELSLVKPGETIELTLWRDGAEKTVTLTAAAEAPPEATGEMSIPALPGAKFSQRDGTVTVTEVTSAKLRKAGLETGMAVVEANGSPVDSLDALAKALRPGVNKVQVRSQDIALTLALEAE
jgi:S1-C subfamily serine protease